MCAAVLQSHGAIWLIENGPEALESLFQTVVCHPTANILIADNDRAYRAVSAGAGKLLGLPREKLIGRRIDDFAAPGFKPQVSRLWRTFLERGEQEGTLRLVDAAGSLREFEYSAKGNVLPVRHVLALRDKTASAGAGRAVVGGIPAWVRDYALYLLDPEGRVACWYAGAERIYGYRADEAIGRQACFVYADEDIVRGKLGEEFEQTAAAGHSGAESWQTRKDGSRFWANVITLALKDGAGAPAGFARVVRDFSERRESDEELRRSRARLRPVPLRSTIAGAVSGEFEQGPSANDAFLDLAGYSREDLASGRIIWADLTPPEYAPLDELAHEESLRFGASTPYEKELVRKDGGRIPVLSVTAALTLSPFRWIALVQDLRGRERVEPLADEAVEGCRDFEKMVGASAALKHVLRQSEAVAPTDATVLILGETGTGKELVARAVHRLSPRKRFPFVTVNCAAIPSGLLESELFGYEKGAFTGALSQKIGRFELAHRGTLFLDEVGDIPLDLQPKLLRALQEKSFVRLGGARTIPIDVRLIAATNRNLAQMMDDRLFRSDLYYRLKVFPITLPPLRDRPDDIPALARHFTGKYSGKLDRRIEKIPAETMIALMKWPWPGNIRELENFIERAVILSRGPVLRAPLAEILRDAPACPAGATLEQVEREYVLRVFRESGGVVTKAAARLGLHRTTLNAMMRRLGISRADL